MKLTWNQFHPLLKNNLGNPIVLAVAKIHVCSKRSKVGDIWGDGFAVPFYSVQDCSFAFCFFIQHENMLILDYNIYIVKIS